MKIPLNKKNWDLDSRKRIEAGRNSLLTGIPSKKNLLVHSTLRLSITCNYYARKHYVQHGGRLIVNIVCCYTVLSSLFNVYYSSLLSPCTNTFRCERRLFVNSGTSSSRPYNSRERKQTLQNEASFHRLTKQLDEVKCDN